MNYADILDHFGTQVAAAQALKINQSNLSDWKGRGSIPPLRQLELEALTAGKLKAGSECDKFRVPGHQAA
ncbi:Cro/CI family transcriptional regulator [Rhizobacter sp. OV335]|uniref:Cro/CI family transcriptional regulator n=1 Tax=Rhizobacter sp. OV335 TaxID=1500264 RepID=UPI0013565C7F|nr:Cro/CI family transcriptional regulator [Rhizobacter sp. OV335]